MKILRVVLTTIVGICTSATFADTPSAMYIFPAGGQRGQTVSFRVGGTFLHEGCPFRLEGPGVKAVDRIERTETVWFEGPVIPQPDSQRKEDYPKDYAGQVEIAADAALGNRTWRVWTSQGVTPGMAFVVGELPEILEKEADGRPVPVPVTLPVTINGRIFPREDVDVWSFHAKAGQTITCEVNAARIGSALDSRLEIRDSAGRLLVENSDALGADSLVHFTAPADGVYSVHIFDEQFGGLQHYVYRLTITSTPWIDRFFPLGGQRGTKTAFELTGANLGSLEGQPARLELALPAMPDKTEWETAVDVNNGRSNLVTLDLDGFPEQIEPAESAAIANANPVKVPVVVNGRIGHPGDSDLWQFEAKKGTAYLFEVRASRLRSPLDSVLTLLDAEGKKLAENDDLGGGQSDSRLAWTAPADGAFTVKIEDRLASRGGPAFAYRLRMTSQSSPDFRLLLPVDAITLERGKAVPVKLTAERLGGFNEEIELEFVGLPEGVTATNAKIGKGQTNAQFNVTAGDKLPIQTLKATLRGKGKAGETTIVRTAAVTGSAGTPDSETVYVSIAMPTPFKFAGDFETKFAPRGGVFTRHYKLQRNGFDGPIEISLADRQNRHLQGVTGKPITIAPGMDEFDFSVSMPPWMEIGRTSRTCLAAVGVVTDADGSKHKVSYSSEQQNDQIITLVDPARLSVSARMKSLRVTPGREVDLPVEVGRGVGLSGPVTVSVIVPEHLKGIETNPVTVAADGKSGVLKLKFAPEAKGPFNMPLTLRATMNDERGNPVTNETPIELVP